jgi:hypothetical protein
MAVFSGIPEISIGSGMSNQQAQLLSAIKENVELLTGTRGSGNDSTRAVLKGQLTVAQPPTQTMKAVSQTEGGFTISDVQVPSFSAYVTLLNDVQLLANDVANLHATVAILIAQLKA